MPILTNVDKGKYGVIIFENLDRYLTMDQWNRELLDKYCRQYQVVGLSRIRGGPLLIPLLFLYRLGSLDSCLRERRILLGLNLKDFLSTFTQMSD